MSALKPTERHIYDIDGSSSSQIYKVVRVHKIEDVIGALHQAKLTNRTVYIAGRRHSMGGQTLQNESIMLDMMPLDKVYYNLDSKTVTVEAGAIWKKVLEVLNQYNRSIKVM